jgi:hypothetical protein
MSEEEVRAAAVRVVKEHLELSDATRVKTSLATAAAIIVTIIGSTIGATWAVGKYVEGVNAGQTRIEDALTYKVSNGQFRAWTVALDKANRKLQPGQDLNVPELPEVEKARP